MYRKSKAVRKIEFLEPLRLMQYTAGIETAIISYLKAVWVQYIHQKPLNVPHPIIIYAHGNIITA